MINQFILCLKCSYGLPITVLTHPDKNPIKCQCRVQFIPVVEKDAYYLVQIIADPASATALQVQRKSQAPTVPSNIAASNEKQQNKPVLVVPDAIDENFLKFVVENNKDPLVLAEAANQTSFFDFSHFTEQITDSKKSVAPSFTSPLSIFDKRRSDASVLLKPLEGFDVHMEEIELVPPPKVVSLDSVHGDKVEIKTEPIVEVPVHEEESCNSMTSSAATMHQMYECRRSDKFNVG